MINTLIVYAQNEKSFLSAKKIISKIKYDNEGGRSMLDAMYRPSILNDFKNFEDFKSVAPDDWVRMIEKAKVIINVIDENFIKDDRTVLTNQIAVNDINRNSDLRSKGIVNFFSRKTSSEDLPNVLKQLWIDFPNIERRIILEDGDGRRTGEREIIVSDKDPYMPVIRIWMAGSDINHAIRKSIHLADKNKWG